MPVATRLRMAIQTGGPQVLLQGQSNRGGGRQTHLAQAPLFIVMSLWRLRSQDCSGIQTHLSMFLQGLGIRCHPAWTPQLPCVRQFARTVFALDLLATCQGVSPD